MTAREKRFIWEEFFRELEQAENESYIRAQSEHTVASFWKTALRQHNIEPTQSKEQQLFIKGW